IGEMLIGALDGAGTRCTGVRFGNVLGSRGSVVPTFERQIEAGCPVTITHPDMTRYFMSLSEAVSLVIQAAVLTRGGDLFVLDMGQPIRIETLARRLIRLRGLRPQVDIPIKYTGIRPGEKLHEELTALGDEPEPTSHRLIYRIRGPEPIDSEVLLAEIDVLAQLANEQRSEELVARLFALASSPALVNGAEAAG
ncbi:MAG: polysaccharide biosynthesis protein, partial [Anaerolineae bacterium]